VLWAQVIASPIRAVVFDQLLPQLDELIYLDNAFLKARNLVDDLTGPFDSLAEITLLTYEQC
jgi:hypothetical protein